MSVVVAVVALVALVALVVIGWAAASHTDSRTGGGRLPVLVIVAVVAAIVVVLAGAVGLLGVRSGSPEDPPPDRTPVPVPSPIPAVVGPTPLRQVTIRVAAPVEDRLPPVPRVVGDLADGEIVVLGISGLDAGSPASVHQCPTGAPMASSCRAGIPLSADDGGSAVVLVDLVRRFPVAGDEPVVCTDVAACSIVVFGTARLEVVTVFDAPAPPPVTLDVDPASVAPGGTVRVTADGLPSDVEEVSFAVCRPGGGGAADCGAPTAAVKVDEAGEATGTLQVSAGRCARGTTCAIAVLVGEAGGPRALAPIELIGRPGAGYDGGRVRAGVGLAAALGIVALWVLRRTDWTPVEGDPFRDVVIPDDPFAEPAGPPSGP